MLILPVEYRYYKIKKKMNRKKINIEIGEKTPTIRVRLVSIKQPPRAVNRKTLLQFFNAFVGYRMISLLHFWLVFQIFIHSL